MSTANNETTTATTTNNNHNDNDNTDNDNNTLAHPASLLVGPPWQPAGSAAGRCACRTAPAMARGHEAIPWCGLGKTPSMSDYNPAQLRTSLCCHLRMIWHDGLETTFASASDSFVCRARA